MEEADATRETQDQLMKLHDLQSFHRIGISAISSYLTMSHAANAILVSFVDRRFQYNSFGSLLPEKTSWRSRRRKLQSTQILKVEHTVYPLVAFLIVRVGRTNIGRNFDSFKVRMMAANTAIGNSGVSMQNVPPNCFVPGRPGLAQKQGIR
jgi:hypothetical protein